MSTREAVPVLSSSVLALQFPGKDGGIGGREDTLLEEDWQPGVRAGR